MSTVITFYYFCQWRVAGVVERGGLENRCAFAGTKGSNPLLSAYCNSNKLQTTVNPSVYGGFVFFR